MNLDTGYIFEVLKQVLDGLNTLKVEGFTQADTYINCMRALDSVLRQLQEYEVSKQDNGTGEKTTE